MKPRTILFISVFLNLAFLSALIWVHLRARPAPVPSRSVRATTNAAPHLTDARAGASDVPLDVRPAKFTWSSIQTNDYRRYIANLRAIGCPEETIRDIIIAEVSRAYATRLVADQEARMRNFRFWQAADQREASQSYHLQRVDLHEEKMALLSDLLGEDARRELAKWFGRGSNQDDYRGFLPKEKVKQVQEINRKYRRLEQDIYQRAHAYTNEDRDAELKKLSAQKRLELAQVLTPRELEDLDLRESPAASYVRQHMPEARSEEEFRAMVKVAVTLNKSPLDASPSAFDPDLSPQEQVRKRKGEEQAMKDALKATLGEARYSDIAQAEEARGEQQFQESMERERLEFVKLAEKEGVSVEAANQVHARLVAMSKEMEAKYGKLHELPEDKKAELARVWKLEAEKMILEVMGEKGRNVFKRLHEQEPPQDAD